MKRIIILVLLVLMVVPIAPTYVVDESYYLYPCIGYYGVGTALPSGELVEWTIECTIFFKGVKMQDMIPSSGNHIDDDIYTAQSFTLSEIFDISITYYVRASIHFSTEYLWSGRLFVDGQNIEKIGSDRDSWAQYKCVDVLDDWSIGFYAEPSGNIRTVNDEIVTVLFLLFFGICVVIMSKKGFHWIVNQRKEKE